MDSEQSQRFAAMCKGLANPVRLQIIEYLKTQPDCITGDIVSQVPVAQSTTSEHLKILKDCGLIKGTISGKATCYCLDLEQISWFKAAFGDFL